MSESATSPSNSNSPQDAVSAEAAEALGHQVTGHELTGHELTGHELTGHELTGQEAYELVDFADIPGVSCPCGTARRGFADIADFPATIHVTEIAADAKLHYHKKLTETYYFLECSDGAQMQLNEEIVDVHPGMCILIRPGTRHRAIGKMKVLIVVLPKFDPQDEWLD